VGGNPDVTPFLKGKIQPPAANEAGWKDTFMAPPGMVSRFIVRWAPFELTTNLDPLQYKYPFDPNALGYGYVWHCHIIDHEDNEMMRPSAVNPKPGVLRTYIQGVDY
jgi:spore coat protein A